VGVNLCAEVMLNNGQITHPVQKRRKNKKGQVGNSKNFSRSFFEAKLASS
jgi:hypothetical protein